MISVILLTYNRSDLLAITLASLNEALGAAPGLTYEIVISDDASDAPHREVIAQLPADRIIWARRNRGLSHNHNKAIAGSRYGYILSSQDDWAFSGSPKALTSAVEILETAPDVGVVNFLPPPIPLACERRRLPSGAEYLAFENDGDARDRPAFERPYSDRPHLKRRAFAEDIGPYREDLPMTRAEPEFQRRIACQSRWRVAYLLGDDCFDHLGDDRSFNPSNLRHAQIERRESTPLVGPVYGWLRRVAKAAVRRAQDPSIGRRGR